MGNLQQDRSGRRRWARIALFGAVAVPLCTFVALSGVPRPIGSPAWSEPAPAPVLPAPPPGGTISFVVQNFVPSIVPGMDACPTGTAPRLRDVYLATLPEAERTRLTQKQNEVELTKLWHAYATGPNGTNICSQPDMF